MFPNLNFDFSNPDFQHELWVATGGAMLVLLQSILSGTRRVWWRLMLSCIIGGGGAALAGHIFAESKWVYAICGVAAIMAENVIFGLFNASEEFKNAPIKVFAQLWRVIVPAFGKTGDTAGAADFDDSDTRKGPPPAPAAAG